MLMKKTNYKIIFFHTVCLSVFHDFYNPDLAICSNTSVRSGDFRAKPREGTKNRSRLYPALPSGDRNRERQHRPGLPSRCFGPSQIFRNAAQPGINEPSDTGTTCSNWQDCMRITSAGCVDGQLISSNTIMPRGDSFGK